jgi:hypothetical protein
MLRVNQGLRSRMSESLVFEDFSPALVQQLLVAKLADANLEVAAVAAALPGFSQRLCGVPAFANGRDVETLSRRIYGVVSMDENSHAQLETRHIEAALSTLELERRTASAASTGAGAGTAGRDADGNVLPAAYAVASRQQTASAPATATATATAVATAIATATATATAPQLVDTPLALETASSIATETEQIEQTEQREDTDQAIQTVQHHDHEATGSGLDGSGLDADFLATSQDVLDRSGVRESSVCCQRAGWW